MVKIVGNRKALIDGDQIEIDEIEYILGDQNHKVEHNQFSLQMNPAPDLQVLKFLGHKIFAGLSMHL